MDRRRLLLAASALLSAPLLARAQAARVRRIGILVPSPGYPDRYDALKAGLAALGWVDGKNLAIDWRHAEGKYERITALTHELLKAGAEVIVTNSTPGVINVRKATTTVPIVSAAYGDPVGSGLAASLARPGGNVTGISIIFDGIAPKSLELAFSMLPGLARPAILYNSRNPAAAPTMRELQAYAAKKGVSAPAFAASTPQEIDAAFAAILRERCDALLALVDPFMVGQKERIAGFALKHRLPAFGQSSEFVESGFLASYGPDFRASFRRAASFVDRILKGANPGELPVEQATALELAVNRRTAAAIGIAIPQGVLVRADRVIE